MPVAAGNNRGELAGVVVVEAYVPESLLTKMEGIGRQYEEYKQIKAMKKVAGGLRLDLGLTKEATEQRIEA